MVALKNGKKKNRQVKQTEKKIKQKKSPFITSF